VTATDDCVLTVVVAVAVFGAFGSGVEEATVAVLLRTVPLATLELMRATIVIVADWPTASVGFEHITVPFVPAVGGEQKKPASELLTETKVVPAGSGSLTSTFCASLGPLALATVTV
jgi:hypothetical protein